MINTPVPGLAPSPAPQEAALHPQAVQVRADQPVDPHAMLGAFEQLLGGYALDAESAEITEPIALVVGTSGSTGTPKRTALTAGALAASATATENFLRRTLTPPRSGCWLFPRTILPVRRCSPAPCSPAPLR